MISRLLGLLALSLALSSTAAASGVPANFTREFYARYNALDLDGLEQLYAEDAELIDPTTAVHHRGRAEIFRAYRAQRPAFASIGWSVSREVQQGDSLVVEGTVSGVMNNKSFSAGFVTLFRFRDGRIIEHRDYVDAVGLHAALHSFPGRLLPLLNERITAVLPVPAPREAVPGEPVEARAFDFWVGDWEVINLANGTVAGRNRIELLHHGRVLAETYTTPHRFSGSSLNAYDSARKRWQQTWMDSTGLVLNLTGNLVDGKMVLSGETVTPTGAEQRERITWTLNPDGTIRQHWEQSADGGATWQTAFDGLYRRAKQ